MFRCEMRPSDPVRHLTRERKNCRLPATWDHLAASFASGRPMLRMPEHWPWAPSFIRALERLRHFDFAPG
jgi:hypothetical protein